MTSANQSSSPLDTVKTFLACLKTKYIEYMHSVIHPDAIACLIRENEPRFLSLTGAIENLVKAEQ